MRGRKAEPIKNLEQYDFDKLSKTQGNSRERKRYLAFAHAYSDRLAPKIRKHWRVLSENIGA